jgi:hypothetical protein
MWFPRSPTSYLDQERVRIDNPAKGTIAMCKADQPMAGVPAVTEWRALDQQARALRAMAARITKAPHQTAAGSLASAQAELDATTRVMRLAWAMTDGGIALMDAVAGKLRRLAAILETMLDTPEHRHKA